MYFVLINLLVFQYITYNYHLPDVRKMIKDRFLCIYGKYQIPNLFLRALGIASLCTMMKMVLARTKLSDMFR
ncbi:hypothetical protein Barb7_00479 [Bacteroidales bacterium Barb7]|nr:hypothetical protein Barb7_00479 [Bacteroidales bacterium Barb7]